MGKFTLKKAYNKLTTYEQVYTILEECPDTRNSDKRLIWEYWRRQGIVEIDYPRKEYITRSKFIELAGSTESLRRSRQKIQEEHKKLVAEGKLDVADSLLAAAEVAKFRSEIEQEKGTHVYRERNLTLFGSGEGG